MPEYTPTVEEVREDYRNGVWNDGLGIWGDSVAEVFDRWLAGVRAEAWDEGHKHRQRLGADDCHCAAWSEGECACGLYGTGPLLSLTDNPYRAPEGEHTEPKLDPRPWTCAVRSCRSSVPSAHMTDFQPGSLYDQNLAHYPGGTR
jgi:hypothetical protein